MQSTNIAEAATDQNWKKVRRLVERGDDVNIVGRWNRGTGLHWAAFRGNEAICELLLKSGANISATDEGGDQPLHMSALRSDAAACELLVAHGADVTAVNKRGRTPLMLAVDNSSAVPCRRLITNDSVNVEDCDGNHALHIVSWSSNIVAVQLMVDCGADTSAVDKHGRTPLHAAAGGRKDCPELCEILLKHDAEINAVDEDGNQPLHVACTKYHTKTIKVMVSHRADVNAMNKHGQTPLHTAAGGRKDCSELYEILLKHDARINAVDEDGNQPLHLACQNAHTETVKWMLSHGADANAANKHGQMPLHTVAGGRKDCPELCEVLLKHSAKTNAVDEDGNQPLHLAGKGAEVNAVDGNGDTSLQVALQSGNLKTAELLLTNGADFKVSNGCGETVLHLLCKSCVDGHALCEDFISHGVSPHRADREGNLPLHISLKNKLPKTSWLLFKELGGTTLDDLQKMNIIEHLNSLLCFAVYSCDADGCQKLLDLGANLHELSTINRLLEVYPYGEARVFPLHTAVVKNNAELCCLLLDHGASVNVQMRTRYEFDLAQPLHLAVQLGFVDVCRLLIERGALINAEMKDGKTPLQLAVVQNKDDIVRLLLSYNAIVQNVKIRGVPVVGGRVTRSTQRAMSLLHDSEAFPDEIVSQGKAAVQIYLSSCNEGTAVTVFLRVDVVGRDGAGKTSLTKSLTLQEFNPDELSTRGVVIDPKCQIIMKEACDWTTPLTSEHYGDMYEKNVTAVVADKLDTPEVKDQYFRSKDEKQSSRKKQGQKRSLVLEGSTSAKKTKSQPSSKGQRNLQLGNYEVDSAVKMMGNKSCESERQAGIIGEETAVILPQGSQQTEEASLNVELSAVVEQCDQQPNQSMKGKRKRTTQVALPQASKHVRKRETTTINVQQSAAVQQRDQQPSQCTKGKRKRKINRKTPAAGLPSAMSDSTLSTSMERMMDTTSRLPETVKERVSNFLKHKESLKKAQKEMVVTVLDYAGQHVFYATHHLCLSKAGFYYVVFDASQSLDGKTPSVFRVRKGETVSIPLFEDETNFDRLLEWMSAIHIMEPDHSHRIMLFDEVGIASPAMFLVGTHADKLREQPGLLERQDELIRKKLEGTVLAKHIIWASKDKGRMCFYVDNTLTHPQSGTVDSQVRLLRQMTEEVARKVAQHHKLPLTWLKFEQEVRDMKVLDETKKTVSVEELFHIAKKAGDIKTKEVLEVLLHYLSNRAVLLYHPKALKSGEEEVVLDVEWLISQLEKVITIHTNVPPLLENDVRRSREKGIMTTSLINHLLSDRQQFLMSLMKHFDLLCRYEGMDDNCRDTADDQRDYVCLKRTTARMTPESKKDVECKAYFMPCLLQKQSDLQSSAVEDGCRTVPLILKSDDICIPKPLFYRLLTRFATRFPRLPQLFANVGYFHVYHGHKLEISLEKYHLQIIVLASNKEHLLPAVCFLVRDYVTDEVNKAKHPGMSGLELSLGFYYPVTTNTLVDSEKDFVSLERYPIFRKRLYVASMKREIDPPSELKVWYPEFNELTVLREPRTYLALDATVTGNTRATSSQSLPLHTLTSSTLISHLLAGSQPHECLLKIAAMMDEEDDMGDDWRKLWTELVRRPLNESVAKCRQEGPTIYTLKLWVRRGKPSEATVGRLLKALSDVYRNDVAAVLEVYAQVSSTKDGSESQFMDTNPSFHSNSSDAKQDQKSPICPLSHESTGTLNGDLSVDDRQDISREASLSEVTACPLVSYATPVQDLIGDTPGQCIVEMSEVLDQIDDMDDDWRRLCSELLNRPHDDEVVSQKKDGPTHFLLKLWCRMMPPSQATVAHLIEALNSTNRNDVARIVGKYCKGELEAICPDRPTGSESETDRFSYSTPVQDLIGDTDTPSQCIVELSKALDQCDDMKDDWRRLWSELLNRPIVEEVVNQKKEGPTRFLLKLWCRTKPPSQATVAHLIEALNSIYRNDIARIVENYCKKLPMHSVSGDTAGTCDASMSVCSSQDASLSEDTTCLSGVERVPVVTTGAGSDLTKATDAMPPMHLLGDHIAARHVEGYDNQDVSRKPSLSSRVTACSSDVPCAMTNGDTSEVTELQLYAVSKAVGSKWIGVGLSLGFKMEELYEYEERCPKSLHQRLMRLLVDWKKNQENPTVGNLILTCKKAGVQDDVKRALEAPQFS